jgi:hypothetical protein
MTPADNSHHLAAATARRSAEARRRAENALLALRSSGESASVSKLATDAGVARSWLYTQPDLIAGLRQLAGQASPPRSAPASEQSLLVRLAAAQERNQRLQQRVTPSPSRTANNANNSNAPTLSCAVSKSRSHPSEPRHEQL